MKNNLSVVKKGMVAAILVTSLLSGAPAQAASTADLQLSLSQLQVLLQNLLAHFSPSVKGASTVVVTTDSELATAIKKSTTPGQAHGVWSSV